MAEQNMTPETEEILENQPEEAAEAPKPESKKKKSKKDDRIAELEAEVAAAGEKVAELTDDPEAGFNDDISLAVISCTDEAVTLPDEPVWPCVCGNSNPLYENVCAECGREFADLYKNVNLSGGKVH